MNVGEVIRAKGTDVLTVGLDTTVVEAAKILSDNKIGLLVVCNDAGLVLGVVSERDVVRAVAEHARVLPAMRVEAIYTQNIVTCTMRDSTNEVMARMKEHGIRHIPVIEFGNLRGLISSRDLLRSRLQEMELEQQAHGWSDVDFL